MEEYIWGIGKEISEEEKEQNRFKQRIKYWSDPVFRKEKLMKAKERRLLLKALEFTGRLKTVAEILESLAPACKHAPA